MLEATFLESHNDKLKHYFKITTPKPVLINMSAY